MARAGARLADTFPFALITIPFSVLSFFPGLISTERRLARVANHRTLPSWPVGPHPLQSTPYSVDSGLSTHGPSSFFFTPYFFFSIIPLSFSHFPIFGFTLFLGVYAYFSLSLLLRHPSPPSTCADPPFSSTSTPPSSTSPLECFIDALDQIHDLIIWSRHHPLPRGQIWDHRLSTSSPGLST